MHKEFLFDNFEGNLYSFIEERVLQMFPLNFFIKFLKMCEDDFVSGEPCILYQCLGIITESQNHRITE